MSPYQALSIIAEQGLPCTSFGLGNSPANAADVARDQGFPVALKISSPDILHKSDVGGVRLNLDSPEAVEKAYSDIIL